MTAPHVMPGAMPFRIVETSVRPGRMLLRACAAFGLALRHAHTAGPANLPALERCAAWLESSLAPGKIALVIGASGTGKSTVLRLLEGRLRRAGAPVVVVDPSKRSSARPVLSTLRGPLAGRLGALAAAGLGEPALLARTAGELSQGQSFRLLLAQAMQKCATGSHRCATGSPRRATGSPSLRGNPWLSAPAGSALTLLCDEFASTLDRPTARTLALALRRWGARSGARIVAASAHDDLAGFLDPDLLISLDNQPARARAPSSAHRPPTAVGEMHEHADRPVAGTVRARHRRRAH